MTPAIAAAPPVVLCTQALESQLLAVGTTVQAFVGLFQAWQVAGEFNSVHFGKDGAYHSVLIDNRDYLLRHVHLMPEQDPVKKKAWFRAWRYKKSKSSDRALVYTKNSQGQFLLIFILNEPEAHAYIQRKEQKYVAAMKLFAKIAGAFLDNGTILG